MGEVVLHYSFLWMPVPFFNDRPIGVGTKISLSKPIPQSDLELHPDGTVMDSQVEIQRDLVYVRKKIKGTDTQGDDDTWAAEFTLNETEQWQGDEINTANIMFARGFLALLTGSSKKIMWLPS